MVMGDTDQLLYKLIISQLTHDGHRHIAGIIKDTLGLSYDMPPSQELKKLVKVCVKWGKDIVEISKPVEPVVDRVVPIQLPAVTIKTEAEHSCPCAAPSNTMDHAPQLNTSAAQNTPQLTTASTFRGIPAPNISLPPRLLSQQAAQSIAGPSKSNIKTEPVSPTTKEPAVEGSDFVCYDCGKSFQAECYLKVHFTKVHKQDKQFSCPHCSKTFAEERYLVTHMKYHNTYRPFVCQLCPRGFMKPSDLRRHLMIHTDKAFPCPHCNKHFAKEEHLVKHAKYHQAYRPFVCQICSKGFMVPSDLKRHLMIHTGERPYTCDVCGQGFIQFTSLATHRRKHFGGSKIRDAAKARSLRKYRKFKSGMHGDAIQPTPLADSLLDVSTSLNNTGLNNTMSTGLNNTNVEPTNPDHRLGPASTVLSRAATEDDVDVMGNTGSDIMSYQDSDTQMANLRILQQLLPQNNNQSSYYPPAQISYPPTQVNYTPTQTNTPYSEPFPMQTNTPSVNPPLILKIPRSLATTASTFVTQHSTSSKQQQSRPPDEVITLISDDSNDDANLTQL